MTVTPFELAQRHVGIKELAGNQHHPLIQWWLSLCGFSTDTPDEVAWCSAFVNGMAWLCRCVRSKSAAARSWLLIGTPVQLTDARVGWDVVVLKRGSGNQPGPEVTSGAPGHVGFYAGVEVDNATQKVSVLVLGGNQGNAVSIARFPVENVLGVRRLA